MQNQQFTFPDAATSHPRPDAVILVYDGVSGLGAMLFDVVKKAVGHEECPLCEITYTAVGKRGAWKKCEARLGVAVTEMHRDELPDSWGIKRAELPCILAQTNGRTPTTLVSRTEIIDCRGQVDLLEVTVLAALDGRKGG